MDANEQSLLKEIKELYKTLGDNIYGEYRGSTLIGHPGSFYEIHANELLKKVQELYAGFHPDYLPESDLRALMSTVLNKEVKDVAYCYEAALKSNVSQKKKDAVSRAIQKANSQIKSDLYSLFAKIEEIQLG